MLCQRRLRTVRQMSTEVSILLPARSRVDGPIVLIISDGSCALCLSCLRLLCLLNPEVLVLVRTVINHIHTASSVVTLSSVGLRGFVQSQSGVERCSVGGPAARGDTPHHPS